MVAVTICNNLGAQENKACHCFYFFPFYLPWSWFFECWVLSQLFHSPLSLLSRGSLVLHFLPTRVLSSAYLRLLIFLLASFDSACASSSLAFHMMYSAYKLNKQGDSIQPWRTPFPIWNQSIFPCPVLTVASWPAYKFLRRQVRLYESPISKNFPVCDPHSQRLYNSQWSRNRWFSWIPLLSVWFSKYWQFDLWFLCLF